MADLFQLREKEIFETLRKLKDRNFVLIGGYAVNAYTLPRFSVDCDIVIYKDDLESIAKDLLVHNCDSMHSVKKMDVPILSLTPQEIFNVIQKWNNCSHVVITGGEPMLQLDELKRLMHLLHRYDITIETNGTIFNDTIKPKLWSISPKTRNSYINKDNEVSKIVFVKNNTYDHLKLFLASAKATHS